MIRINWYNYASCILKSVEVKDESTFDDAFMQFMYEIKSEVEVGDFIKIE